MSLNTSTANRSPSLEFYAELEKYLKSQNLTIKLFNPSAAKPITLQSGQRKQLSTFYKDLQKKVLSTVMPSLLVDLLRSESDFEDALNNFATDRGLIASEKETEGPVILEEYKHLELCVSLEYTRALRDPQFFLVNKNNLYISSVPASVYISQCHIEDPASVARPVHPIYDPSKDPGYFKLATPDGEVMDAVNSYVPATWVNYEGGVPDELPEEIEILFNQIKGTTDRKFFYHFLYQMIAKRNSVFLVLQGDGGIGKTVMKEVFKALVGDHNYANGKLSTLTSNFNSQLKDTRLVVFDEIVYSSKEEAAMKEIPNSSISIEAKHKNASRSTEVYCSMILMNNFKKNNYIAFDGRKFAPVQLSNKNLKELLSGSTINKILKKCSKVSDPEHDIAYIAQIGRWILKHGNSHKAFPQGEYRGPKYWELAHSSMFGWQRNVVATLIDPHLNWATNFQKTAKEGNLYFKTVFETMIKRFKKTDSGTKMPQDISAYREFLHIYRDLRGDPVFKVGAFDEDLQDFTVHILPKEEIDL